MIKLKLTTDNIKAMVHFLQVGIEIAKEKKFDSVEVTEKLFKIAERNAFVDEFERAQRKLITKIEPGKIYHKKKTISITKTTGYFMLIAGADISARIEQTKGRTHYTNFVMTHELENIIKELI